MDLRSVFLLALGGLLSLSACDPTTDTLPPAARTQGVSAGPDTGAVPIHPDSIHAYIAGVSEALLDGQPVPTELTAADVQADLDTLAARMPRRLPYFEAAYGAGRLMRRLDSLKRLAPEQTRDQRLLSLFQLLNAPAPGTGHSRINPAQRPLGWRALPLWMYRFADGVFVMTSADSSLVGSEVLAIGETPIDTLYARLAPYAGSDTPTYRDRRIEEQFLRWANPLRAVGVTDAIDTVPVRIRTPEGEVVQLQVESVCPDTRAWVRFRTSLPPVPRELEWSPASNAQNNREPFYRIEYRDAASLLYVQFNTVLNESDFDAFSNLSVADVADSLRAVADAYPIDKVVVDLRTNTGGNHGLIGPLTEVLGNHPKIDRRGVLYTLISPYTYSAAGTLAMEMERRTKTLFAGEPSGFAPSQWGEVAPTRLPHSKVAVQLSYAYYQRDLPDTVRPHLQPDLHVPFTSDQHFRNDDRTLQAVLDHTLAPLDTIALPPAEQQRFAGAYRLSPLHVARIAVTNDGLTLRVTGETLPLRLHHDGPAVFLETALYSLSSTRLATDISDVFVDRAADTGTLTLVWKDTTYALTPTDPTVQSPVEDLRAGRMAEGVLGLQMVRAAGLKLGNNIIEAPLTEKSDRLLAEGRPEAALPYVELAAELAPMSWRVHADLAEAYHVAGRPGAAWKALQRVRELDPRRYDDMLDYLGIDSPPDD